MSPVVCDARKQQGGFSSMYRATRAREIASPRRDGIRDMDRQRYPGPVTVPSSGRRERANTIW
jgi:hypothetical protein